MNVADIASQAAAKQYGRERERTEWAARHAVTAAVIVCAIGFALATNGDPLSVNWRRLVQQNSTLESYLKNAKFALSYLGLIIPGEAASRLTSLVALCCSHATTWLKWPNVNLLSAALEGGLLIRGGRLAWGALRKALGEYRFTERELRLYTEHFEQLSLSKREYRELLNAGAEWRHSQPASDLDAQSKWDSIASALTFEGEPAKQLVLLTSGEVTVRHGGVEVAILGAGALIGDSSFARNIRLNLRKEGAAPAIATVVPRGRIEYVAWPSRQLAEHMAKSSYAKACLLTMIAAQQADKLEAVSEKLEAATRDQSASRQ